MHPDLYNFHTRSLATTSAALGSSTCSALALTQPGKTGNHRSCQYSHSWNDGRSLATAGFFTPAKQALGTTSTALTIQHGPVSQLTPITEDRFQHELCLHPNPDKVVYVGQGLGDGFHLGFNYYSTSFKWTGGGGGDMALALLNPHVIGNTDRQGGGPLHLACPPCRPCEPFQCLTQTPPTWEMSSLACQALLVTVSLTGLRARIILYST